MTARATAGLDQGAVVAIAAEIVDESGLNALTLKLVAERAGVTQPALYRHVDGLDDLWRLLGLQARTELAAAMAEASIGLSGVEAVRAVANAWRDYGRRHPGRYRSTERSPVTGDDELGAAVQRVVDVLALALRSFALPDPEVVHRALLLRSALHGFVTFEIGDGHPPTSSIDDTFDRLIELLCSSLEGGRSGQ